MNAISLTSARMAAGVFSMFAGKDAEPVNPLMLLPYPDRAGAEQEDDRMISAATRDIAVKLIKDEDITYPLLACLLAIKDIEEGLNHGNKRR